MPGFLRDHKLKIDMEKTVFTLKDKIPPGAVALAPMDGYTDMPFRKICREFGSAFSFSEFVSADALCRVPDKIYHQLAFDSSERPLIFQLFGSDVPTLTAAAKKLELLRPDGIDINMGCSIKKIYAKGAGIGLMREPEKVKQLFKNLRASLKIPLSAKIRLGWSQSEKNYLEIAKILEGEGAWAVFIHGRTGNIGYKGDPSWDDMALLANSLSIPVFGNGDIATYTEAREKIKNYGLYGALIGRKAIGNPWLFAQKNREDIPYKERLGVILRHFKMSLDLYGEHSGVILFRKHLLKYLKGLPHSGDLKNKLAVEKNHKVIEDLLQNAA